MGHTYKLVDSLHGWVGLGFHRVENGTTAFLRDTDMAHQHKGDIAAGGSTAFRQAGLSECYGEEYSHCTAKGE